MVFSLACPLIHSGPAPRDDKVAAEARAEKSSAEAEDAASDEELPDPLGGFLDGAGG